MACSQCEGIESTFNRQTADKRLKEYRQNGPAKTTELLLEGLKAEGVNGLDLLDIGGGVGVIMNELLDAGVREATDVDASAAFLDAARQVAAQQSHSDRIRFLHGDFVDIAPELQPADIVTLDRVICCYHDMDALVGLSAARARKLYGLVFPRESWWVRLIMHAGNLFFRMQRNPFRSYIHPARDVEAKAQSYGFQRSYYRKTLLWQVVVYRREMTV